MTKLIIMKHLHTPIKIIVLFFFFFNVQVVLSNVLVLNGLTHEYSGQPGETVSGEVILINSSSENQRVTFDLNDAIFSCTANRFFTKDSTHIQSSRNWFVGDLMDRTLYPKEKFVYRFKIVIPHDETLVGSFWSMLMINIDKPIKEETLKDRIGLDTKVRYAIGLLTNVNSYDQVNLDFLDVDIVKNSGELSEILNIKVGSDSNFIEGVRLSLEVYDKNGNLVFEGDTKRNMIFPGYCRDFGIDISTLETGDYTCVLVANTREEFFGTNFTLQFN